jgi:hypothetical protein
VLAQVRIMCEWWRRSARADHLYCARAEQGVVTPRDHAHIFTVDIFASD